jgi:hypothetical protein
MGARNVKSRVADMEDFLHRIGDEHSFSTYKKYHFDAEFSRRPVVKVTIGFFKL